MNGILHLLIFCIILFGYIHIQFHLKTSDDLEIYEIDQPSKDKLEEICDLRQPVLFEYPNDQLLETCNKSAIMDSYGAFDVKLRDITRNPSNDEELYIPLSFSSALSAIGKDKDHRYIIEGNIDFLEETGLAKVFKYNDTFIRPAMASTCTYDVQFASNGSKSPFKYDINYRNYLLVTEGAVKIKLSPPKSSKYLHTQTDYENLEFRSPINPWDIQPHYKSDFDKIKCLEVNVTKGHMIYIPAFWWYSIDYGEASMIAVFKYMTFMNTIAISPKLIMQLLQTQNVKRMTVPLMKEVSPDNTDKACIDKAIPEGELDQVD